MYRETTLGKDHCEIFGAREETFVSPRLKLKKLDKRRGADQLGGSVAWSVGSDMTMRVVTFSQRQQVFPLRK